MSDFRSRDPAAPPRPATGRSRRTRPLTKQVHPAHQPSLVNRRPFARRNSAIGGNATGIQADSGKVADFNRPYSQVKADAGRIDILRRALVGISSLRSARPVP
jgi:hypothetical protein